MAWEPQVVICQGVRHERFLYQIPLGNDTVGRCGQQLGQLSDWAGPTNGIHVHVIQPLRVSARGYGECKGVRPSFGARRMANGGHKRRVGRNFEISGDC